MSEAEVLEHLRATFDEAYGILESAVNAYTEEQIDAVGENARRVYDEAVRLKTELENVAASCEE